MTAGRSPPRTLLPDTVGSDHQQPPALQGRANKAQTDQPHRFRELYGGLAAARLLDCGRALHQPAASGVDGRTAPADAVNVQANVTVVAQRLKGKRDRATLVRRCYRPQENGAERPLGLPARDDQLGPWACAKLLTAIDAQDLLDGSYGYRPGRGALAAVRARPCDRPYGTSGYLGEAAVNGCCAPLDHTRLLTMWRERLDERALLRLMRQWLQAGLRETDGLVVHPETGSPQGGCRSPVLAHVYGHDALDRWCETVVKPHGRGEALLGRYAADWVCACRYQDAAARFYRALPKR
jgi:retron-type reverse transcriptase